MFAESSEHFIVSSRAAVFVGAQRVAPSGEHCNDGKILMTTEFTSLNLRPELMQAISELGYTEPTPI